MAASDRHGNGVQSLSRAFVVLGLVAAAEEPLGVSELGRRADLAKTTTARLVNSLVELGALEKASDATLRIGPTIGALVTGPSGSPELLRQLAAPQLNHLADAVGEHAALAVPDGGDVLYVAQVSSPSAVDTGDWTGIRYPPHVSAFGHVLMTDWSPKRVARYLAGGLTASTSDTIVDPAELKRRLDATDTEGVAWCVNESAEDVTGVASAVVDAEDKVVGAIGLFAPSYRFPGEVPVDDINRLVLDAAAEVSANLTAY